MSDSDDYVSEEENLDNSELQPHTPFSPPLMPVQVSCLSTQMVTMPVFRGQHHSPKKSLTTAIEASTRITKQRTSSKLTTSTKAIRRAQIRDRQVTRTTK